MMATYKLAEGIGYYGRRAREAAQELFSQVTCRFPSYSGLEAVAVTQEGRVMNIPYGNPLTNLRERVLELMKSILYTQRRSEHPATRVANPKKAYKKPVIQKENSAGNGTPTIRNPEGRWLRGK